MNEIHKKDLVNSEAVDLSNLRVIDGCLIFDMNSGKFQSINESAAYLLNHVKGGTPLNRLATVMQKHYDISRSTAERDVELFLNDLNVIR